MELDVDFARLSAFRCVTSGSGAASAGEKRRGAAVFRHDIYTPTTLTKSIIKVCSSIRAEKLEQETNSVVELESTNYVRFPSSFSTLQASAITNTSYNNPPSDTFTSLQTPHKSLTQNVRTQRRPPVPRARAPKRSAVGPDLRQRQQAGRWTPGRCREVQRQHKGWAELEPDASSSEAL
jgi:hypothetical protein